MNAPSLIGSQCLFSSLLLLGVGSASAEPVKLLHTPDGGIQPQAAVDGKGVVHLIYYKGDPAAGDIFYVVGRERGEYRAGEAVLSMAIRTSRVFRRIEGEWRQVHHHGSIDDPELLAAYQQAVRSNP